jgi:hypothetical protein
MERGGGQRFSFGKSSSYLQLKKPLEMEFETATFRLAVTSPTKLGKAVAEFNGGADSKTAGTEILNCDVSFSTQVPYRIA